jgi:hypothetical protein
MRAGISFSFFASRIESERGGPFRLGEFRQEIIPREHGDGSFALYSRLLHLDYKVAARREIPSLNFD